MKKNGIICLSVLAIMFGSFLMASIPSSSKKANTVLDNIEAISACEVSSVGGENVGYCSRMLGGHGDVCTETGDQAAVRCSGNI